MSITPFSSSGYPYSFTPPGLMNVGSYQVAGQPFLTSSFLTGSGTNNGEVMIRFPFVSKSFTVVNKTTNPIWVHFDTRTNTDVRNYGHYLTLETLNDSVTFDMMCRDVYISLSGTTTNDFGRFELIADLTGIDRNRMFILTGSGINNPAHYETFYTGSY